MNTNEKLLLDTLQGLLEDACSTKITLTQERSAYVTLQGNTFTLYADADQPLARLRLVPVEIPQDPG